MAFDQSTRNRLQKLVSDCRKLLSEEFSIQLQQNFGINPYSGELAGLDRLTHLSDRDRQTAQVLRDTLAHYLAVETDDKANRIAAINRIIREQAFTVLNRLAALLMMEARGLLAATVVSQGQQSQAFELYKMVAGSALGETGDAYRTFLFSLFDEFAIDLPALFDRYAAQGRLFPREPALLEVLEALNHHEIRPLWAEDETIGWIYQYFNSKEERKAMRDASPAPRNSRELAVRNQFFTPRYVVEFLVDNTLGRMWFNATGGKTELRERCQYLLAKPDEQPQASTRLRDPRTLKLLDPACGSMHFGLYAFDLFLQIYQEAWGWEQAHGPGSLDLSTQPNAGLLPLCQTYSDQEAYQRDVPRLIVEHNIYGVDIDPRAAQIASLAVWLRAQRAWHDAGIKAQHRPDIGRGHVVAAVAPPAERDLRQQFAVNLDKRDAELFEKTLQLLKGLPELGVLLQVERELPSLIRQVYIGTGTGLFAAEEQESWEQAEDRLRSALVDFAHSAKTTYQGQLFAQDALEGLRLIDLSQEVFDVVVMNPPFGDSSTLWSDLLKSRYKKHANNLFCAFISRAIELCSGGYVGAITDNTWLKKSDYESVRELVLNGDTALSDLVDLGWGVLDDANVATCAFILSVSSDSTVKTIDLSRIPVEEKWISLQRGMPRSSDSDEKHSIAPRILDRGFFENFPGRAIAHETPECFVPLFSKWLTTTPSYCTARRGYTPGDTFRFFRLWWELSNEEERTQWWTLNNGGSYSPLINDGLLLGYRDKDWSQYRPLSGFRLESEQWYGKAGIGWGKRTDFMYAYPLPAGSIFSHEGHCAFPVSEEYMWPLLAYLNSSLGQQLLNLFCGQHKLAGYVSKLPCPPLDSEEMRLAGDSAKACWEAASLVSSMVESSEFFQSPFNKEVEPWNVPRALQDLQSVYLSNLAEIDRLVDLCAGKEVNSSISSSSGVVRPRTFVEKTCSSYRWGIELASYIFGCAIGRWSITSLLDGSPETLANDPFCEIEYPTQTCEIPKGVFVSDIHAAIGIEERMRECISEIWGEQSDDVEAALLDDLGAKSLQEYLTNHSGFFSDHLDRYSKGRRSAPIYWPLSTSSGKYTVWIYYPYLCDQTLFTALNDFVDPKLDDVRKELKSLRDQSGGRSKEEENYLEALAILEYELVDLRTTLLDVAPNYRPNKNDGIQITSAPLWKMFRHKPWQKVLKDTWEKLEEGEYDWAHLAMDFWPERVREKCVNDKSLAIAHGLEHLHVEAEPTEKKTRGRKKAGSTE